MTIEDFIGNWHAKPGGAERSNLHLFIINLCDALGVERPEAAQGGKLGRYEFDAAIPGGSFRSTKGTGFIDLYKRGCFVLEAKQSQLPADRQSELGLFEPAANAPTAPSGARYDRLMSDARAQAENYAKNLPGDQPPVPFILVLDIGRAFEIEFDTTGNGRGYAFFPDKQRYRIELPALADPAPIKGVDVSAADLLRAIWTDPASINPRLRTAQVTTGVARRLAQVSQYLEQSNRARARDAGALESQTIEETSLFLMRIIFCMFAENVGLLPERRFEAFLERTIEDQAGFENGLHDLWSKMNTRGGGYAFAVEGHVRYYNGGLFESNTTFVISNADRGELYQAAKANWRKVEPAIFGTLLEQALSKQERAKLGAHYTPRPYVERLVQATIMDVLEAEWATIQNPPRDGDNLTDTPLAPALAFHARITALRILDPACGTGNFLYVAMEALQQLEAKVIEFIETLGGEATAAVGPHQFFGLELNPRAAKIAELVLWIGWLRFRIANDPADIDDPVLDRTANINFGRPGGYDAVLVRDEFGEPDTTNPRISAWPEADFIIGNPPFIGGKDIRSTLSGDYAEALWQANPRVPKSADFVMQWWDRAAHTLLAPDTPLRRFGFVTTNSITQEFSRRVISRYLSPSPSEEGSRALSLIYAIPDHPWTKASKDSAAVRIAMTVAEAGAHDGRLVEVTREAKLDSDEPDIALAETDAVIHANLTVGVNVGSASLLRANEGLSSRGVPLHGAGFIVTPSEAKALGLGQRVGLEAHIRAYRNGRDLLQHSRGKMVIDFDGLEEKEVRQHFPEAYEHLLANVKPERDRNKETYRRENWWLFGRRNTSMRAFTAGLDRYIATVETSKHRIFQFLDASILPDNKIVAIGHGAHHLGILQSSIHVEWALRAGGWLGVGNDSVYVKSKVFDTFPFPNATPEQRTVIAELAEELDVTRKAALAEVPRLTMTEIYNLRDMLRSGETLSTADRNRAMAARAGIVNRLHEQIDAAVADAYGWGDEWRAGALPPSEIVARLVALNGTRAAEEAGGHVRWLRPDYQIPRFGDKTGTP